MSNKTGRGLADYAIIKVGTPYFYGSKMSVLTQEYMESMRAMYPSVVTRLYILKAKMQGQIGKVNTDCSGLIYGYTKKNIGSAQLYSQAEQRLPISDINSFPIGTVLWKKGHVGVYIGTENGVPMCVEAKGIAYGTIKSKVSSTKWEYGLLLKDLDYTNEEQTNEIKIDVKGINPYAEPVINLKKGSEGDYVKWLQWELKEAGYELVVDGKFGAKTLKALREFQKSAKLTVDGICGKQTRNALKGD